MIQLKARFLLLLFAMEAGYYVSSQAGKSPKCAEKCIRAGLGLTNCPPNHLDCLCKDKVFLFNVYDCIGSREYCATDGEIAEALAYAYATCATVGIILPTNPFKDFGITTELAPGTAATITVPITTIPTLTEYYISTAYTTSTSASIAYGRFTYVIPMYKIVDCADIQLNETSTNPLDKRRIRPILPPIPGILPRGLELEALSATVAASALRNITDGHLEGRDATITTALKTTIAKPTNFFHLSKCIVPTYATGTFTFTYPTVVIATLARNVTIVPTTIAATVTDLAKSTAARPFIAFVVMNGFILLMIFFSTLFL